MGCACFCIIFTSCREQKKCFSDEENIEYYINNEANTATVTAVNHGFEIWEREIDKTFSYIGTNYAGIKRDGKNTISFLMRWPPSIPSHHIAYCNKWYQNGKIIEADIIFNMSLVKFTTLGSKQKDAYCIEGVLIHEIGHLLGLGHIDDEKSIMSPNFTIDDSYILEIDSLTLFSYNESK